MNTVSMGTKIRTIALFVTLINQVLACFNISPLPFDQEQVTFVVSTVLTGVAAIAAWWKNNTFTKAAINADKALQAAKTAGQALTK
jgi:SPP1 family holin